MAIIFDEQNKTFTIHTEHSTYQMQIDPYGVLLHLYYGRKTKGCMDYLLQKQDRGFSGNLYDAGNDRTYSLDVLPQEFPTWGTGDYRSTALIVRGQDGTTACDLRYRGYRILSGKYGLSGLPAVYGAEKEAQTLEVVLEDGRTGIQVTLLYGVLPKYDVITRSAQIINTKENIIYLEKAASACLDFVTGKYDVISFYGRHAMERNYQRIPVSHGNYVIGSRRGTSSHQYSPFLILTEEGTTEDAGACYAMSFVYSGGFQAEVEKDQFGQNRMLMGLQPEQFSYPLNTLQFFVIPETVMTYSRNGLAELSQNLHRCFRNNLCRGPHKEKVRPILINSWEASYFDFDGESILKLAEEAKELGIEMLVLDDGWFGKRRDDNRALGDWQVNEEKLKCSLGELSAKIHAMGLKFGLWVEPEMVSEDSDLYRAHPDWALQIPGKNPVRSRNQLVLDFSRKDAVDFIFDSITEVLDYAEVEYLKWDMNRSLCDVYSAAAGYQGKVLYDYVLGVYDFLDRLLKRYPNLLIEGCSGGGGRFDAGMLYYTPQIWCSDNTDALDRLQIQYGTSFAFPISAVGSHVSAVPNHQTGRKTPLSTRGAVAMAGTFGYELDLGNVTEEEKEEIRQQIKEYKQLAPLIQTGLYYRLSNPVTDEVAAWEFVSEDGTQAMMQAVMTQIHGNMTGNAVKWKGLEEEACYQDAESGELYYGAALMETGILLPIKSGAYQTFRILLRKVGS